MPRAPALVACAGAAGLALAGCAPWLERPLVRLVPERVAPEARQPPGAIESLSPERAPRVGQWRYCRPSATLSRYRPGIDDAVEIGPLTFWGLGVPRAPDRFTPGSMPVSVRVTVPPKTQAIISVPGQAGLDSSSDPRRPPRVAVPALRCVTWAQRRTFEAAFVVPRPTCLPVTVDADGRRTTVRVPFGVRDCP